MNDLTVADNLTPANIASAEQGAKFVKVFRAAVEAARSVGADRAVTNKYAEKLVRSVRVTGGLIAELPREKGGRGKTAQSGLASFCQEVEVSDETARKWQLVAAIPESEFEQRIAELRDAPDPNSVITLSAFYGKPHVSNNSGENEWYTPPDILHRARRAMGGIDCDPASNALANKNVKAGAFYSVKDNGLEQKWRGRVWLNPPYSNPLCSQFCEAVTNKFASKEIEQACVLVNNATETAWFQQMLRGAAAVCLLEGRVKYLDKTGEPANTPLQGQAVLYFGSRLKSFGACFSDAGQVLVHG